MKTQQPTPREIDELVSYLPKLYAEGFKPASKWGGGTKDENGVIAMGYPVYEDLIREFFDVAAKGCWCHPDYLSMDAGEMLRDKSAMRIADIHQIKAMLTWCVRGERFCGGHWEAMIEEGHIRRLLERLVELRG